MNNLSVLRNEVTDKLYEEWEEYFHKMTQLSPTALFDKAYEISAKREIIDAVEIFIRDTKSEDVLSSLLKAPALIEHLYNRWLKIEDRHFEEIYDSVAFSANELCERFINEQKINL